MNLDRFYLFSQLGDVQKALLKGHVTKRQLRAGQILFYQGDDAQQLCLLAKGVLKAYKCDASGNEIVLHYFQAPAVVAEMAVFKGMPFPATISCESDVEVWLLSREVFMQLIESDAAFAMAVIHSMSQKIKILESTIDRNMTMSATQRVARMLYETPELFEQMPQTKIAALLNMSPETLNRILKRLKTERIIALRERRLEIRDGEALHDLFQ